MSILNDLVQSSFGLTFDLEGTLVDLEPYHFMAFEYALRDFNVLMTVDEITVMEGMIGGGDPLIAHTLALLNQLHAESLLQKKDEYFNTLLRERSINPRPYAVEVIEFLKGHLLKVAVGSLTP